MGVGKGFIYKAGLHIYLGLIYKKREALYSGNNERGRLGFMTINLSLGLTVMRGGMKNIAKGGLCMVTGLKL